MVSPLVAVPAYHLAAGRVTRWRAGGYAVPETYVDGLRRAGVRAAILAPGDRAAADEVLDRCDGLLLVGGGDIEPSRYGQTPHPQIYGTEPDRDALELALTVHAVEHGIPVLAICRGLQLVNVAFGGTLHQHLPDVSSQHATGNGDGDGVTHGVPSGDDYSCHDVRVEPGSRLAAAVGGASTIGMCTSVHHQGIDTIGGDLVPTAWSGDGLVEAVELPLDRSWLLAVQWHPEMTAATDPVQQALFDAFASALTAVMTSA